MSLSLGARDNRVRFERQSLVDDDYGNSVASWTTPMALITVWAAFRPVFGREQVVSGQLLSTLTGVLTVLSSSATRGIRPADRVVFTIGVYTGKTLNIRSIVPTPDGAEIELLVEETSV